MTEADKGAGASSAGVVRGGRFATNFGLLRERLARRRVPAHLAGTYPYTRLIKAGGVAVLLLIVILLIGLDAHTPGWAKDLSDIVRGLFRFLTGFGKSGWLLVSSGVLGLVLLFSDWSRVGRRMAAAWAEIAHFAGFFFFALVGAGMTTNIIKWVLGRSRPRLFDTDGIFSFSPISFDYAHVSFPSGHTTTAATAFAALALILYRWRPGLVVIIGVFAAVVGISRVAVRAHFPSDVAAGIFVGVAFTVAYAYLLGRSGVAFQRLPDGTLMARTTAIRAMVRRRGFWFMLGGLWAALSGRRRAPASGTTAS